MKTRRLKFKIKFGTSLRDRIFGMLLKENSKGILLKTRWGIHTFFMKFPIDVYILDSKGKVVKIKRNLKPNRLFFWNPKYNQVVELKSKIVGS